MTRASRPDPDPRLGTVLRGKYRLDRVIGSGGMAVVYQATHRNHAEFAVKMLYPELSVIEDIRSRFVREGYAANAVKHPGVVLVVDDDVAEDGAAFLVMELLDGVSCEKLWGSIGKRVSVELASAITIQLLDVLAAAHDKRILHRDIKPANLFLTRSGVVKVLDFGIAKAREAAVDARATGSGMVLGTPAFMAPEHARGRAREMDGRTDLWAAAASFFALVSGELVHGAETTNEFLIAAGTRPARSLAAAAPGVPRGLVEVIDRALAFEKGDRWPTAGAMREALVRAHREAFGGDGDGVERVVAAAVKGFAPAEGERVEAARAVETPVLTERLSTSAATAGDRGEAPGPATRWGGWVGIGGAIGVAAVLGTVWMGGRRGESATGGGADGGALGRAARVVSSAHAEGVERAAAEETRIVGRAEATASPASDGGGPAIEKAAQGAAARGHGLAVPGGGRDAGPAATCSPPWFFDSAGHKQYKAECI